MGIFSSDARATDTIEGFASALESCGDVRVVMKGAIVHICGTLRQVENVSKSIEAIVSILRVQAWGVGTGWHRARIGLAGRGLHRESFFPPCRGVLEGHAIARARGGHESKREKGVGRTAYIYMCCSHPTNPYRLDDCCALR